MDPVKFFGSVLILIFSKEKL